MNRRGSLSMISLSKTVLGFATAFLSTAEATRAQQDLRVGLMNDLLFPQHK
jgi:hypothetical protein